MDWNDLAQAMHKWGATVTMVMILQLLYTVSNYLTT
jgi:hypothetical protein